MINERYFPRNASHQVDEEDTLWVTALQAIDKEGSKELLLKLLRDNTPMSPSASWHLADLLDRYKIATQANKGGKKTPSYDLPPAQIKLERAKRYYLHFVDNGLSEDQAIQNASIECEVDEERFRSFLAGRNSSARRIRMRRPPPNTRP
jgi:hypothetical protein